MSKNEVKPEGPQSIWHICFLCWISKATRAQAHTHTRALTPTPTHTHAQEFTNPCVQARTHKQKYVTLTAFPLQQCFRQRISVLRYTYIVYLIWVCVWFVVAVYLVLSLILGTHFWFLCVLHHGITHDLHFYAYATSISKTFHWTVFSYRYRLIFALDQSMKINIIQNTSLLTFGR
jgi:hypothetical protein